MIIQGHLNYFSIDSCGLYKHGNDLSAGLDSAETFDLIFNWVKSKPMEETIPWDPNESRNGIPKCYCHDFYKCETTGDYLFVLWKSDSDSAGAILGAQASASTGNSKVIEYTNNYKGKKVIWGRPCYYWIIPSLKTIISVKLDHSVCDSSMFQDWVSKCISNRVSHAKKNKVTTDTGQVRFEFLEEGKKESRYSYRFDARLRSLNTGNAKLSQLAARVTHIVRRSTIKLSVGIDERPEWVKIFDKIPLLPAKPKATTRQIEVRAEAKPSVSEIKTIIENFAVEDRKPSDWNNVGFETEAGIVWADRYRLHEKFNFNKTTSTIFSAAEMHTQLKARRDHLLHEVVEEEKLKGKIRPKKAAM